MSTGTQTNGTSPTAVARRGDERKALVRLGNDFVAVRLDEEGYLTRVQQNVRLEYGPHLYCAKVTPGLTDKVAPYQPGYMKMVLAMGGQLVCPPAIRDPLTGEVRPNPLVEVYPDTGIVRRVTATAVCAVRNPATGAWVVSVQTQVQDAEAVLHQALLKIGREDAVRTMSYEDYQAEKSGELKGWVAFPLMPPFVYIVANMRNAAVIGAFQTFREQATTIRQRACSKAERLAADHNPVTRRVWEYGAMAFPRDDNGEPTGAPYVEIPVVAWVEHRGRAAVEAFVEALASHDQLDGVGQMVLGEPQVDAGDTEEPEDALDAEVVHHRQLPASTAPTVDLAANLAAERALAEAEASRAPVEVRRPEPAKSAARPAPEPARTAPQPADVDEARSGVLAEIARLEDVCGENLVAEVRRTQRLTVDADLSRISQIGRLNAYRAALASAAGE